MGNQINGHMSMSDFLEKFPGEEQYPNESNIECIARIAYKTRIAAERLFRLLDNIDTLDDMCKDNDKAFREHTNGYTKARFAVTTVRQDDTLYFHMGAT